MGEAPRKTCFVVMGFGEKTDFYSTPQRVLNLNRTYENIIKPTVEDAGITCIRADEIIHSTVIDKPMYEQLLEADLVIADLSTSNANALYELGVRHALRPHTTIVISEKNFSFPFDLGHLSILKYEHLGTDIGFGEVMRVRNELRKKIDGLVGQNAIDSPVFLFLPTLGAVEKAIPDVANAEAPRTSESIAELMENFNQAKEAVKAPSDWLVVACLRVLKRLQPDDPYVIQQLALATYKSEQPDRLTALQRAKEILLPLAPEVSSDAETVGLWGAIHKRVWDVNGDRADLDSAIAAYERGFYLRRDTFNGINYAFLLDVRASLSAGDEGIADRVLAKRCRRTVLDICDALLKAGGLKPDAKFWVDATRVEALLGVGRVDESNADLATLLATNPPAWMAGTLSDQLEKLRPLLPKA